jgi:peptidyl-prolyl cis-trans isomerase SurA
MNLLKMLRSGTPFDQLAADSSDDKSAKENRGRLGFVTAMFPDGFYEMERAVYAAKPGDIVGPVRTPSGYNLVQVHGSRPARGEMEVAHILVRKGETPEKAAMSKSKIDSAYTALKAGATWDDVCKQYSEDAMTSAKSGYIGFFGINRYQKNFEEAAFALKNDGDYAAPVETSIGWHIIKRISRRAIGAFEDMKRPLGERVKRDSRSEIAKQTMINRIKKEANFQENAQLLQQWTAMQEDSVFHTFRWKPNPDAPQDVLLRFGADKTYTLADFEQYCSRAGRERMRGKGYPVSETVNSLYKVWSDDCAMQFEETQLEKKYPEFRSLMREYEEGILLFEAAKRLVWDRANTDSTGLEAYFNSTLKGKYKWEERAKVSFYTVKSDDPKVWQKVREMAGKKPSAEVLKKFNKTADNEVVAVLEKNYEKGKNKDLENLWKSGAMSEPKTDAGTKTTSFLKVEELIPPISKELNEARGYAVADYQDYLEKKWVEDLRKEYKVNLDQKVFDSLVKK